MRSKTHFFYLVDDPMDRNPKSKQNAFIESFNGSLRDELLNEEMFDSLNDVRQSLALS